MGEVERVGSRLKYTLDTIDLLYGIKAATCMMGHTRKEGDVWEWLHIHVAILMSPKVIVLQLLQLCHINCYNHDTVGYLFSRTTIFADFANFLFYTKIVSPKYVNIYARINHNHIRGSP